MLASPDLISGLGRLVRYPRLISDAATITLDETAGGRWVRLDAFSGKYPVPRQRYEFGLLTLLRFCLWRLGLPLTAGAAEFPFPEPVALAPYDLAFGCPLPFDGAINWFLVSEDD